MTEIIKEFYQKNVRELKMLGFKEREVDMILKTISLPLVLEKALAKQKEEILKRAESYLTMTLFFVKSHPDCDLEVVKKKFLSQIKERINQP